MNKVDLNSLNAEIIKFQKSQLDFSKPSVVIVHPRYKKKLYNEFVEQTNIQPFSENGIMRFQGVKIYESIDCQEGIIEVY